MNWVQSKKMMMTGLTMGLLVFTGTYNSVVINSDSGISGADVRFAKRLDEVFGIEKKGREVAATVTWQKLDIRPVATKVDVPAKERPKQNIQTVKDYSPVAAAASESLAQAAVQEELSLSLTDVINPKKWQKGLTSSQFSGSLETSNGIIESLSVSLPNGEGISVSFSEMTGNVFEYDYNGDLYSGMMYQVDQNSYMVNLTNGPLEGTRMRFSAQPSEEQQKQLEETQQYVAESLPQDNDLPNSQDEYGVDPINMNQQPGLMEGAQDIYAQEQMLQPGMEQPTQQVQGYNFEYSQT
jgi:hypothetical protein